MNALLTGEDTDATGAWKEQIRKVPRRIVACPSSLACPSCLACSLVSRARVFGSLSLSVVEIKDYSQSNKEMAFVTRKVYLQEELLTELIVPGFLNHTIYVDTNFLLFCSCLLLLLSTMASCVETFEAEVIDLCLFTLLWGIFGT